MKAHEQEELLQSLKVRFEKNMHRHEGVAWTSVQAKLERNSDALRSLREMEVTGGEPDVVGQDKEAGHYTFFDCSAESPAGRRSVCYDREALDSRKENKPQNSAVEMATAMGIDLLTEEQYRELQKLASSMPRLPAGSGHPPTFEPSEELSSVTDAMARCSCTTTAPRRTTPPEASAGHFECDPRARSQYRREQGLQTSMTTTEPGETLQSGVLSSAAEPMLSQAIVQTLLAPAADRASLFAQLVGEIVRFMAAHPEERPWTCAVFRGTDGSTIFRGGVGHSLVVDPAGGLWRARSYEDFDTTYRFTDGLCEIDTLTPRYAHLREYHPRRLEDVSKVGRDVPPPGHECLG